MSENPTESESGQKPPVPKAPNTPKALSKGSRRVRNASIGVSVALLSTVANFAYTNGKGRPDTSWLRQASRAVDEHNPFLNGNYQRFRFAGPICSAQAPTVEVPSFAQAAEIVRGIDFVENDPGVVESVATKILEAPTLKDARNIAQDFLAQRGIQSIFYGFGDSGVMETPIGTKISLGSRQSEMWQIPDSDKQKAIANIIRSFSILPSAFFEEWADTVVAFPENIIIEGGHARAPTRYGSNKFEITMALSQFKEVEIGTIVHEAQHRDHMRQCGIDTFFLDPQIHEIDDASDKGIPQVFEDEYGRDKGLEESVATTAEGIFRDSVSSLDSDRGGHELRKKQMIILNRYALEHDISSDELLALAEIYRIYGTDTHPLSALNNGLAPIVDRTFERPEGFQEAYAVSTPLGKVPLYCFSNGTQVVTCRTRLTPAIFTADSFENIDYWHEMFVDMMKSSMGIYDGGFVTINPSWNVFDENYPQRSGVTIEFDNYDPALLDR